MSLSPTEFDLLAGAREQLLRARRGEKAQIVERVAGTLGCSTQTAYRKLGQAGLDTGRKRRSDAGTSVLTEEELRLVAGVLHASSTQRGQRLPVRTAIDILLANGRLSRRVDESTVSRQLYLRRLHPEQMTLPTPSVQMQALHSNHFWQGDSTTGIYYFMPGGKLRFMPEDQFYKNKLHNVAKAATDLVTRYSVVDVATHSGKARHYLGGETAENLLDFLTWAMWKHGDHPMHGVPFNLMLDPGAANKGHLVRNFCDNTGIKLHHHAPGAARVTGSVEKFHDLVGMHFERRLRFQDPKEVNLDRLNDWLDEWVVNFCATRIHTRHKMTRLDAWMGIKPEHLRVPASLQALRDAAVAHPEQRRVDNHRTVSFRGRSYDLSQVPGVAAGLKVTLQLNVFRDPHIDVQVIDPDTGEEAWQVVAPVVVNELGYREGAPVWGEEFRTAAYSDVDHNRTELLKDAYKTGDGLPTVKDAERARKQHAQAYAGQLDVFADVKAQQLPAYLPRRSTPLGMPERKVQARVLNMVEALVLLKARMGAAFGPQVNVWLREHYPDGVPEDQLDQVVEAFNPKADDAAPGLRLIGGGAA